VKFISSSSALFEKTDDENRALAVYPPFFPQLSGFLFYAGEPLAFFNFLYYADAVGKRGRAFLRA